MFGLSACTQEQRTKTLIGGLEHTRSTEPGASLWAVLTEAAVSVCLDTSPWWLASPSLLPGDESLTVSWKQVKGMWLTVCISHQHLFVQCHRFAFSCAILAQPLSALVQRPSLRNLPKLHSCELVVQVCRG